MPTETLLVIVLIILLVGALPTWPYSRSWGYGPSIIGVVVCAALLFWAFSNNKNDAPLSDIGDDLRELGRDVKSTVKETGEETKEMIQDVAR